MIFWNIKEIHMAVLNIMQYELVPAPEFPGTAHFISASQEMGYKLALWCVHGIFLKPCLFWMFTQV